MKNEKLSRREREIVDLLFSLGGAATAEEVRERLSEPPTCSAVRAMLAKLEAKGAIRHREQGPRYVYSPTAARATARKSALRKLVATFFEGSPGQAMTALLNDEKWTENELDQLALEIEKAKSARRKP